MSNTSKFYDVEVDSDGVFFYKKGTKEFHREDGPAVENLSGNKYWYLNDKYHREDGPAIVCADGTKYWWLNGKCYSEADFHAEMKKRKSVSTSCEGKIIEVDGKRYKLVEIS